jgi:hypothetical protein
MGTKIRTKQQIQDHFQSHCMSCLGVAVQEYISRASDEELKALLNQIQNEVGNPFR